jgi:L-lysine exporter family protein LysE/ArgO
MFSSSAVLDVSAMVPVFGAGLVLTLSLIAAIGAQNTYVLRQGLRREHVALVVLVCVALDAALMALGISGLAAFLVRSPVLLRAVACLGAAALAWYAWQALGRALQPQALQAQAQGQRQAPRQVLAQVLGISLLNPHVYLDTVLLIGAMGGAAACGGTRHLLARGPPVPARCGFWGWVLVHAGWRPYLQGPRHGACWTCRWP